MKSLIRHISAIALAACVPLVAIAQDAYPTRTVKIIVPYPPGGVADSLPRIVGEKLTKKWGQAVIVENKAGASGSIGMGEGARAAPDGYTMVLAPAGNLTVNPTLFPNLPFDTHRDLKPVTLLAQSDNVLVVHPSVPVKNYKEFVDYAKANPDKLNFSSPGDGSGAHLAGELFKIEAGIKAVHVPYKGMAPAVQDLLGGNVQFMFAGISTVIQHIRAGKLVPIAIASPKRNSQLPDVPTVAESGLPGFDVVSWYGIVTPARTPPAVIQKVQRDISEALRQEDVRAKLATLGLDPIGNTPEAFDALIRSETRKWVEIMRKANIAPRQ